MSKSSQPDTGRMTASSASESRTVNIRLPKKDLPAPEGVNYMHFTQVGTDVQMLVGYLDLDRLRDAIHGTGELAGIDLEVSHRFSMSLRGFAVLYTQIKDLAEKMTAQGVPLDEISKQLQGGE